jgi:hypothetical protein
MCARCGTLSRTFANIEAFQAFDAADPFASRCVDEDFNRLWSSEVLNGHRQTRDLARARELRPVYDETDYLLDLHSMTDPCPPLALSGRQQKGLELAHAVGLPEYIIIDGGHAAGKRLRDYAAFDDPVDPRNALLIECGQHWERLAPDVAKQSSLRFLRHFGMVDAAFLDRHLDSAPLPPQRAIEGRTSDHYDRRVRVCATGDGSPSFPNAARCWPRWGDQSSPHDDSVLIMPTRRPKKERLRIGASSAKEFSKHRLPRSRDAATAAWPHAQARADRRGPLVPDGLHRFSNAARCDALRRTMVTLASSARSTPLLARAPPHRAPRSRRCAPSCAGLAHASHVARRTAKTSRRRTSPPRYVALADSGDARGRQRRWRGLPPSSVPAESRLRVGEPSPGVGKPSVANGR